MITLPKIISRFGEIEVFTNKRQSILYAVPNGYIGPGLIKKDLRFLADFNANSIGEWTYIVNISNVKFIHPINPFLLRELKQLSFMKEYVVYAPSAIVRFMMKSTNWINKPDRIIKDNKTLQLALNQEKQSKNEA